MGQTASKRIKKTLKRPLEEQAKHADIIFKLSCIDPHWIEDQILNPDFKTTFPVWTKISIGNIAYLVLHAPTQELRDKCMKVFAEYKLYVKANM